jgi:alpha-mannosidase
VSRPIAAGPTFEAPGAQCKGRSEFEYAFTSYGGDYVDAGIVAEAHAYAFPAIATMTNRHKGKIKSGSALVEVDNPSIAVSAVETLGRKGAWTVRLYNTSREAREAGLTFWTKNSKVYEANLLGRGRSKEPLRRKGGRARLNFRPAEIKTLQVVPKT